MINIGVTRRDVEVLVCFHHSQVHCGSWLNPWDERNMATQNRSLNAIDQAENI